MVATMKIQIETFHKTKPDTREREKKDCCKNNKKCATPELNRRAGSNCRQYAWFGECTPFLYTSALNGFGTGGGRAPWHIPPRKNHVWRVHAFSLREYTEWVGDGGGGCTMGARLFPKGFIIRVFTLPAATQCEMPRRISTRCPLVALGWPAFGAQVARWLPEYANNF